VNLTSSGKYNLYGSVKNETEDVPVSGAGNWVHVFARRGNDRTEYRFDINYTTSDNGHVVLDHVDPFFYTPHDGPVIPPSFSELLDVDRLGSKLSQTVGERAIYKLVFKMEEIMEEYVTNTIVGYLQKVFSEIKLIDIILPQNKTRQSELAVASRRVTETRQPRDVRSDEIIDNHLTKSDQALRSFINKTLWKFGEEIIDDPFIIAGPVDFSMKNALFQLKGEFRDIRSPGLSKYESVSLYCKIPTNESDGALWFDIRLLRANLTGQYNLSGSLAASLPMNGSGQWTLTQYNYGSKLGIYVSPIRLVNGHLQFSNETGIQRYFNFRENLSYTDFPGLLDFDILGPELIRDIEKELDKRVIQKLDQVFKDAVGKLVIDYLKDVFEKIPLEEMISRRA
jgi:hypothetical protein